MHEHGQLVPEPLAVLAVAPDAGQALGQHPAGVVVHGRVQPLPVAEGAARPACRSSAQITRRAPTWPGPSITLATATGSPAAMAADTSPSSGKTSLLTGSTKMSRMPPQVRPDRERVVVADAVGRQHRLPGLADLAGQLVDGPFDAAAGHAAR